MGLPEGVTSTPAQTDRRAEDVAKVATGAESVAQVHPGLAGVLGEIMSRIANLEDKVLGTPAPTPVPSVTVTPAGEPVSPPSLYTPPPVSGWVQRAEEEVKHLLGEK